MPDKELMTYRRPRGVVGIVTDVSDRYAKVLMMIDQNSAVDAVVQRNRARGMVRGEAKDTCALEYVLFRHDLREGDVVVTSGLDGVFPKGLRIGTKGKIVKLHRIIGKTIRRSTKRFRYIFLHRKPS